MMKRKVKSLCSKERANLNTDTAALELALRPFTESSRARYWSADILSLTGEWEGHMFYFFVSRSKRTKVIEI